MGKSTKHSLKHSSPTLKPLLLEHLQPIHRYFEEQARLSSGHTAIEYDAQNISYEQLNLWANQLAHYLIEQKGAQGKVIAIFLESPLNTVLCLLAILKAGAAYVMISSDDPPDRIESILVDSETHLIITSDDLLTRLKSRFRNICTSYSDIDSAKYPISNPLLEIDLSSPAFISFTSGSTGKPKGVVNRHIGAANFLSFLKSNYGITSGDKVIQLIPFCFIGSVREVFGALQSGATLVLDKSHNSTTFFDMWNAYQRIRSHKITVALSIVPTVLRFLTSLAEREKKAIFHFRLVVTGGENLYFQDVIKARKYINKKLEVINQYGATELTMVCTFHKVETIGPPTSKVPIGKPIDNVAIHLLDESLQPTRNSIGDIHVDSPGTVTGYLDNHSSEKFLQNPFENAITKMLYYTGDTGRLLPDGSLEFVGRNDKMVVFNGFRIELEEIERTLEQHPEIELVVAFIGKGSHERIECLYQTNEQSAIPIKELKSMIEEKLPKYMVPSRFTHVISMAQKSNGKIDRKSIIETYTNAIPSNQQRL